MPDRENCNNNLGRSSIAVNWFAFIPYGSRQGSQFPGEVGCWKQHVSPQLCLCESPEKVFPWCNWLSLQLSFPAYFHSTSLFILPPFQLQIGLEGAFPGTLTPGAATFISVSVLLGSLAQALLMAAALEAEGVARQMQNCVSDAILVMNHLKMVLSSHNVLFLSFGQRNVLALSGSNLYVN